MSFLKNPFQKKYIPVLVCAALGVAAFAATGLIKALVVMGLLGLMQYIAADKPMTSFARSGYSVLAAIFISMAVYYFFVGVVAATVISGAVAVLPLSILLTRKVEV